MPWSNIWQILAGLGIFLFGMLLLEESIRNLSGKAFRGFIRRQTSNRLRAVGLGILATVILQSSSAVSLMVLAFTGAGIMTTVSAIGVVIGASLGTTISTWIIATVGFKLKIEVLALPFIGIGGLGLLFFGKSTSKWINISKLLVGFGFLFMGLDYMKSGVEDWTASMDIADLKDLPGVVYFLFGLALAALIHSSTASLMIVMSSVYGGVLDFGSACLVVIGINIGATITVLVGSASGASSKKKVAFSNLIFNITTATIVFLLLPFLKYLLTDIFRMADDPVMALAAFHMLFNLVGLVVFFPFIGMLARLVDRMFKEKTISVSRFIQAAPAEVPEAGIAALHNEVQYLIRLSTEYVLREFSIDPEPILPDQKDPNGSPIPLSSLKLPELYDRIKLLQDQVFEYGASIQKYELNEQEAKELARALHAARYAVAAAKSTKDIRHNLEELDEEENRNIMLGFKKRLHSFAMELSEVIQQSDPTGVSQKLHTLQQRLRDDERKFVDQITSRLNSGIVNAQSISAFLAVNRGLTLAGRQSLLAVKDLVLSEQAAEEFDLLDR